MGIISKPETERYPKDRKKKNNSTPELVTCRAV